MKPVLTKFSDFTNFCLEWDWMMGSRGAGRYKKLVVLLKSCTLVTKNWWCYQRYNYTKLAKIGGAKEPPALPVLAPLKVNYRILKEIMNIQISMNF